MGLSNMSRILPVDRMHECMQCLVIRGATGLLTYTHKGDKRLVGVKAFSG
jgi:hypothetical protein